MSKKKEPIIADFGLVSLKIRAAGCGTMKYAAPEVFDYNNVGKLIDF